MHVSYYTVPNADNFSLPPASQIYSTSETERAVFMLMLPTITEYD